MDRLTMTNAEIEEIRQYSPDFNCPVKAEEGSITMLFCDHVCDEFQNDCPFMKMGQRLKNYEDAEEQGLILRLPCKVGDTVYRIVDCGTRMDTCETDCYSCKKDCPYEGREDERVFKIVPWEMKSVSTIVLAMEQLGKTVFLTKEEAEQALANMKEGAE